jgi:hypothetical protein
MSALDGRCLCGAVTYTCAAEPLTTAICHCTECQRQSGTAFSILVGVAREDLQVSGDLATFTTVGDDSGQPVARQFCPGCGSPIVSLPEMTPDLAFIKAGTLDDVSALEPELEVWCQSAQPWVALDNEERGYFPRGLDLD